ncbi:MAG TPA: cytochrome c peroxidase [Myxococcota bacterium]|nr:cytochrome c peroxidase [Myxococcota bacterium]
MVSTPKTRALRRLAGALLFAAGGLALACGPSEEKKSAQGTAPTAAAESKTAAPALDVAALRSKAKGIFGVLPAEAPNPANPITPEKVTLGRMLFYEPRITLSRKLSCSSCHGLDTYGVDNQPTSVGHEGQRGERNSPTVYNAALEFAQFWDGRAPDVEEQAKGPVLNPVEMAMPSAPEVVSRLKAIPGYGPLFAAAFPGEADPITFDNAAKAVAAFERKLMTPGPFDDFMNGNDQAMTPEQLAGLQTFMDTGCITCHNGATVGGRMFQKLGLVEPYPTKDVGREKVTGNEGDRYFFKVPMLRNVAKTGPWFHDGSIQNLDDAIRLMARHQLGKQLGTSEIASIRAFLESLTGRIDAAFVARPELPPDENAPAPKA